MVRSFIKAAAVIISVVAFIMVISLYDSEKFAEPIIGYSEAVTQIPLDSMWEETEHSTEETTVTTILTSESTVREEIFTETVTEEKLTDISKSSEKVSDPGQNILININTATVDELKQLNGVGDVIAARIVEYAQTVGFKSIEDIKNVKGIGDKKFDNIKDKITV